MRTIAVCDAKLCETEDFEREAERFVPLTAAQAAVVRAANPITSPWWVVAGQVAVGGVLVLVAWAWLGVLIAKSVACGVLAVVAAAALFARGLTSQFAKANPGSAVLSFFVWELVKMGVTVAVMFVAHRWVTGLSWPAMLVGLVVTMKVYWLALALKPKPNPVL